MARTSQDNIFLRLPMLQIIDKKQVEKVSKTENHPTIMQYRLGSFPKKRNSRKRAFRAQPQYPRSLLHCIGVSGSESESPPKSADEIHEKEFPSLRPEARRSLRTPRLWKTLADDGKHSKLDSVQTAKKVQLLEHHPFCHIRSIKSASGTPERRMQDSVPWVYCFSYCSIL